MNENMAEEKSVSKYCRLKTEGWTLDSGSCDYSYSQSRPPSQRPSLGCAYCWHSRPKGPNGLPVKGAGEGTAIGETPKNLRSGLMLDLDMDPEKARKPSDTSLECAFRGA